MIKMEVRSSEGILGEILAARQLVVEQEKRLQVLRHDYMRLEQSQAAQNVLDALREVGLEHRERMESLQERIRVLEVEFDSITDATKVVVTVHPSINRLSLFLRSLPSLLNLENLFRFPGPLDRFLPEECLDDLNALCRRLLKKDLSKQQIRFQVFGELIKVLWAFHVQIRLDNLRLQSEQSNGVSTAGASFYLLWACFMVGLLIVALQMDVDLLKELVAVILNSLPQEQRIPISIIFTSDITLPQEQKGHIFEVFGFNAVVFIVSALFLQKLKRWTAARKAQMAPKHKA